MGPHRRQKRPRMRRQKLRVRLLDRLPAFCRVSMVMEQLEPAEASKRASKSQGSKPRRRDALELGEGQISQIFRITSQGSRLCVTCGMVERRRSIPILRASVFPGTLLPLSGPET